jgi:precorrin-2 dehydrogenase/sirohydrochlorin ferrochelatase
VAHAYPLLLDVSTRPILILGGGGVAVRKAAGVLAAGATVVRVVSPVFSDRMPPEVERIVGTYHPSQLDGVGLVFAATNVPAVNASIVDDCRRRGILVSRADEGEGGDFASMAVYRDVAVTVGVSASGSPAIAARLRDDIARHLDRDVVMLADAARQLRPMILERAPESRRGSLNRRLASDEAIAVLKSGGVVALQQWLQSAIDHE